MLLLFIIFLLPVYYYLFKYCKNEYFLNKQHPRYFKISLILLYLLAIISLFTEEPFLSVGFIIIPLTYIFYFRKHIRNFLKPLLDTRITVFILLFFSIFFLEIFAGIDQKEAIIIHQLKYFGFYFGLAIVIYYFFSRYKFSFLTVLIIGGLWGVLIEQEFAGPKLLYSDPINFIFFAPFIFLVYGFLIAGPYILFFEEFKNIKQFESKFINKVLFFISISTIPLLTWGLWLEFLALFGVDTFILPG